MSCGSRCIRHVTGTLLVIWVFVEQYIDCSNELTAENDRDSKFHIVGMLA
jgi:hypothetical protein